MSEHRAMLAVWIVFVLAVALGITAGVALHAAVS
jgi:hypothetical protein